MPLSTQAHAKLGRAREMRDPGPVEPHSLFGRLLDLMKHLERQGHVSPTDWQLVFTIINHPEMPEHFRKEGSRPSYPLSAGYDGPVEWYLG